MIKVPDDFGCNSVCKWGLSLVAWRCQPGLEKWVVKGINLPEFLLEDEVGEAI